MVVKCLCLEVGNARDVNVANGFSVLETIVTMKSQSLGINGLDLTAKS